MKVRRTLAGLAVLGALFFGSETSRVYAQEGIAHLSEQERLIVDSRMNARFGYGYDTNSAIEDSAHSRPIFDPFYPATSLAFYLFFRKGNIHAKRR